MSELVNAFEQAVIASKQLPKKPSPQGLLQLYSLYKQATVGDNTGPSQFLRQLRLLKAVDDYVRTGQG